LTSGAPPPRNTVSRSIGWLFLGRAVTALTTLAATYLLARGLPTEQFGLYALFLSIFAIAGAIVDFGGNTIATREIARDRRRASGRLGILLIGRALLAVACTGLAAGYLLAVVPVGHRSALLLACIAIPLLVPGGFEVWFHVTGRLERVVVARTVAALVFVAGLLGAAGSGSLELGSALGLRLGVTSLAALWIALLALREVRPVFRGATRQLGRFFRSSGTLGIATACTLLYFHADTLMLEHFRGPAEVAVYQAAYRIFGFAVTVLGTLLFPFFPVLSRLGDAEAGALVGRMLFLVALVSAPPAAAFGILAPDIARDFYGGGVFEASVVPMAVLAAAFAVIGGGMVASTALLSVDRERTWLAVAFLGLLGNVAANAVVLPRYGASGAAFTTLATELAVTVAALVTYTRRVRIRFDARDALVVTVATVAAAAGAAALRGKPLVISAALLLPAFVLLAGLGIRSLRGGSSG